MSALRNARAAALSLVASVAILHGHIVDETPGHHDVGNLNITFCDTLHVRRSVSQTYSCGSRRWRTTTDRFGRFSISGMTPGWYITAGKSDDVAWYESVIYIDPARAQTPIEVCSFRTDPHTCPSPKFFGANIKL